MSAEQPRCAVLVRGLNDVASAVAYVLFQRSHLVAIHESDPPKSHRRLMAFVDAFFDGEAALDGVTARRCDAFADLARGLKDQTFIPLVTGEIQTWLTASRWSVLVDARMRKRTQPEPQRGMAALTIGLGPGHAAGQTADIVIETMWGDRLGAVLQTGPTLPLTGEPRAIRGVGRERNVYAPLSGVIHSDHSIGEAVAEAAIVAAIDETPIRAPISGTLRGLTRPGIAVLRNDKIVEVDPRPPEQAGFSGLGERPRHIANGVAAAIEQWAKGRA